VDKGFLAARDGQDVIYVRACTVPVQSTGAIGQSP
jgi:hypothetical protein